MKIGHEAEPCAIWLHEVLNYHYLTLQKGKYV